MEFIKAAKKLPLGPKRFFRDNDYFSDRLSHRHTTQIVIVFIIISTFKRFYQSPVDFFWIDVKVIFYVLNFKLFLGCLLGACRVETLRKIYTSLLLDKRHLLCQSKLWRKYTLDRSERRVFATLLSMGLFFPYNSSFPILYAPNSMVFYIK